MATSQPPGPSHSSHGADDIDRRRTAEELIAEVISFAGQWRNISPEVSRNLFQDWSDDLSSAALTDREAKALRRVVQKLSNSCSDRAGTFADNVPIQALPSLIFAACAIIGAQIMKLPAVAIFGFITIGFSIIVVAAWLATKHRRWRIPVDAMNAFEKELRTIEKAARPNSSRYESEDELVRRLNALLHTRHRLLPEPLDTGAASVKRPRMRIDSRSADTDSAFEEHEEQELEEASNEMPPRQSTPPRQRTKEGQS